MKLYEGKRFWPEITEEFTYPDIDSNIEVDVVIIGGGMSGMLSAYALSRDGKKVLLIERDKIANGSSSLNTGLIQYMSDVTMIEIDKNYSKEISNDFYKRSKDSLNLIETFATELNSEDVGFKRCESIYVTNKEDEVEDIRNEVKRQNEIGFDAEYLSSEQLSSRYGVKSKAGLISKDDVELNPMQFVASLSYKASKDFNLLIKENTEVKEDDIDLENKQINLDEITVRFNNLVLATGYNIFPKLEKYLPKKNLVSSFALITNKIEYPLINETMFWESSDSYLYFRKSPDGRLIIGGEDEDNTELSDQKAQHKAQELIDQVNEYLVDKIDLTAEFYYEAIFGESEDGMPYLGPHPKYEFVYVLCGIGGNGTVYSAMGARDLVNFINGKSDKKMSYLWPNNR